MPKHPKAGDRIGAMLSIEKNLVQFLGFGLYEGDETPPKEIGFPGINPKMKLDNGDVVWGCECWWGAEDDIKARINKPGLEIKQVSIADYRTRSDALNSKQAHTE